MSNHLQPAQPARAAGIVLHPTSLPGPYGIGDLGPSAFRWLEWLARARQSWWQVLPLGPTGYGDSPYQSFSSFAGNLNLLSPELLVRDGLLRQADLADLTLPHDAVDFGKVMRTKSDMLAKVWESFKSAPPAALRPAFEEFRAKQADWLDDYALFMALKSAHGGVSYLEWPREYVLREPQALARVRTELHDAIGMHQLGQFLFFRQWQALRDHARTAGVRLIGDIPIFVSGDSADVWGHPELFQLDARRRPAFVAGVPPDYFSATGQLWGNPLYEWDKHQQTGYAWWLTRLRATLALVDLVRIDHFRGFEAYWEIPAGRLTAEVGRWVKGPGADLFHALRRGLGGSPFIGEDLGLITPEVVALREELGLPGMSVLQFAFDGGPTNKYLPHTCTRNTVIYTGTHDNDTTVGWFAARGEEERRYACRYVPELKNDPAWALLRQAWASVADLAVAPLQDVLALPSEARMNSPGKQAGNWGWRFRQTALTEAVGERLAELTETYGRAPV